MGGDVRDFEIQLCEADEEDTCEESGSGPLDFTDIFSSLRDAVIVEGNLKSC